jgi:adenine-specific DNA-methyltransferase
MRYIGSKTATLGWLSRAFAAWAPDARSLCDPFAGTCTVARHFKSRGMRVVTGDVLKFSHVLQMASIGCDASPPFDGLRRTGVVTGDSFGAALEVLACLQAQRGIQGYIYDEFSPAGVAGRLFFTPENAALIDAIRGRITDWQANLLIDGTEAAFLLAALIDAADRVANTAGTYYAHLKAFSRKSRKPLRLRLPPTTPLGSSGGCFQSDAKAVVATNPTDILYLDPPYNERNYAGYYHLPETLAYGDAPLARGRSGAPAPRVARSDFYIAGRACEALAQICSEARARHIVVHYAVDGAINHQTIIDCLAARGEVRVEDRAVRAYASRRSSGGRQAWHRLYWCDVRYEGS